MFFFYCDCDHQDLHVLTHSLPTRRASDLAGRGNRAYAGGFRAGDGRAAAVRAVVADVPAGGGARPGRGVRGPGGPGRGAGLHGDDGTGRGERVGFRRSVFLRRQEPSPTASTGFLPSQEHGILSGMRIFTIGYEGATQDEVIAALRAAGVTMLADVRAVPLSRRPGFSKKDRKSTRLNSSH